MTTKLKYIFILIILCIICGSVYAKETTFDVDGSSRNFVSVDDEDSIAALSLLRVNAFAQHGEFFSGEFAYEI